MKQASQTWATTDHRLPLRRFGDGPYTDEYNVKLQRLLPGSGAADTRRWIAGLGLIHRVIEPGRVVDEHAHDEEECFVVLKGEASMTLGDSKFAARAGDVIYIPRNVPHGISNPGAEPFSMLDLYWDDRSRENLEALARGEGGRTQS